MSKMLVALNEGGIMEDFSDGPAPYTEVRLLDCQNGEAGDIHEFDESWRELLNRYFGDELPQWVHITSPAESAGADARANRVQMLLQRVAADIAELRRIAPEPFSVPISGDGKVDIELRPNDEDNRVTVGCKLLGDTVVNYTDDGLVIDVYTGDQGLLEPISSLWFDASDLKENPDNWQTTPVEGQSG